MAFPQARLTQERQRVARPAPGVGRPPAQTSPPSLRSFHPPRHVQRQRHVDGTACSVTASQRDGPAGEPDHDLPSSSPNPRPPRAAIMWLASRENRSNTRACCVAAIPTGRRAGRASAPAATAPAAIAVSVQLILAEAARPPVIHRYGAATIYLADLPCALSRGDATYRCGSLWTTGYGRIYRFVVPISVDMGNDICSRPDAHGSGLPISAVDRYVLDTLLAHHYALSSPGCIHTTGRRRGSAPSFFYLKLYSAQGCFNTRRFHGAHPADRT